MPLSRASRLLAPALLAPFVALACAWSFAPPLLNTDSAFGFLVWESMAAGGPWNSLVGPDPADLARDHAEFLSWWSPGQWFFPGLARALGATWSQAALLTTLAAILVGILGVRLLGRRLGLAPEQTALACLLVSVAGGTLHAFGMFWGGDILLIAAAPLLYLAAVALYDSPTPSPLRAAAFFAACLVALFCKHSALLAVGGALLFCAAESRERHGARFVLDRRLWLAVAAAALAGLLARLLWLGHAPTPASGTLNDHDPLAVLAFSLNGPWFSLTGAGSLLSWLGQQAGAEPWSQRLAAWLLLPGVAATALVLWLGFRRGATRAWRLAACAWATTAGLLIVLYLRGATISLEERHFRPAVAPLALALASAALPSAAGPRSRLRFLALALVGGALLLGVAMHARRIRLLADLPRGPVSGFSQPDLPVAAHAAVTTAVPPAATLGVASPTHALEFPGRRLWVTDAFFRSAAELAAWRFHGAPRALVLALPASMEADGRGALLRAACVDSSPGEWRETDAAGWRLWTAPAKTSLPSPP